MPRVKTWTAGQSVDNRKQFNMRVTNEWLGKVDDWRRLQRDIPSRSEAIRRLVEVGIEASKLVRKL
jgi:metal-responsive CopG/Arc/MetJ family transcriptional regulator